MDARSVNAEVELARALVMEVAPEEQELFNAISAAYQRDPDRFADTERGRDEMLGFGIETAAALMTPIVLAAVAEVMRYLAVEVTEAIGVRAWLHRLLRRKRQPVATVAALDPAQLAAVRQIVLDKCRQAGAPAEKSELVADGVVGALTAGRAPDVADGRR